MTPVCDCPPEACLCGFAQTLNASQQRLRSDHNRYVTALSGIRGVILGPVPKDREKLLLINEIVGEALYGDFAGTLERAREDGRILP